MFQPAAIMASSPDYPAPRASSLAGHRRTHTKSRLGCYTCKRRRVKCDEARPICGRCQKAGRECLRDPRLASPQVARAFKYTICDAPSGRLAVIEEDAELALEYFRLYSLPIFCRCEPSSIWAHLTRLLQTDPSVCRVAAAIGYEHRCLVENTSRADAQACTLYARALHWLRRSISTMTKADTPDAVFRCLLLVILQSLRDLSADMLIHLQSGLSIALDAMANHENSPELRESTRLLKKYSMASVISNTLSKESHQAMEVIRAALRKEEDLPPADFQNDDDVLTELHSLTYHILDLLHSSRQRKPTSGGEFGLVSTMAITDGLRNRIMDLRARQEALEAAVDARLHASDSAKSYRTARFGLTKARCLVAKILLRGAWIGYQTSYDMELETFNTMVDLVAVSTKQMQALGRNPKAAPDAFSVGLGAIWMCMFVAQFCRHSTTRRRAIDTLERCPRKEGNWTVESARAVCKTLLAYEERKAAAEDPTFDLTGYIPERCRVRYYHLGPEPASADTPRMVRMFRRLNPGAPDFVHEDVPLEAS